MPHENIHTLPVGPAWDALSRMDAEALVALCAPEVKFESRITGVDQAIYEGHDGIRRYLARLAEVFEWIEVERLDVVESSNRAVVTNRFRACGRGSGVEVEQQFFVGMTGRDGTLLWWGFFDSRSEALEAVGLQE
jgi:ketosteroid isomerase-like protein